MDDFESLLPLVAGSGTHGIEVEVLHLGFQVLAGVVHAHCRDADFGHDGLSVSRVKGKYCDASVFAKLCGLERFGELGGEIDILVVRPAASAAHAGQFVFSRLVQGRFIDVLVVQQVRPVHDDVRLAILGEGVAVYAGVGGGSQFGLDVFVRERHAVIARFCVFVLVGEGGCPIDGVSLQVDFLGSGAEQQVAQVDAPRTAEVGMRETFQRLVAVVVTGAGVPVAGAGVRAELYGTMGYRGSRIGVSVEACPDKRVYVVYICLPLRRASQAYAKKEGSTCKDFCFH